jgi:hypothetical protein
MIKPYKTYKFCNFILIASEGMGNVKAAFELNMPSVRENSVYGCLIR